VTTERQRFLAAERQRRHRAKQDWLKVPRQDSSVGNIPMNPVIDLGIKEKKHGLKIGLVLDAQVMDGVEMGHLTWLGKYYAEKRPDVIVCIGDFGDFPSLSQFGQGTAEFENRRYRKDLDAFHEGMDRFMTPIAKVPGYDPFLEFCDGNHEGHIPRAINQHPNLVEGIMSLDDLKLKDYGWRQHAFLQPISIAGVAFCHYFPSGIRGQPITTAAGLMNKLHMSAVAGHQQGRSIHYGRRADGRHMTTIISGSFYQHSYKYLSPYTNGHWRGTYVLHEVRDGQFDEMPLSIDFLKRKFG
jgi:hypothetical protein